MPRASLPVIPTDLSDVSYSISSCYKLASFIFERCKKNNETKNAVIVIVTICGQQVNDFDDGSEKGYSFKVMV